MGYTRGQTSCGSDVRPGDSEVRHGVDGSAASLYRSKKPETVQSVSDKCSYQTRHSFSIPRQS